MSARWLVRAGPGLGLLLVVAIFAVLVPESFLSAGNWKTVATQTVIPGICALGMTCVIAAGGIDLSVGSQVALASIVAAGSLQQGHGAVAALAAGVGTGALCGAVNGLLITRLAVVPFVATLGMLGAARGLAKLCSGEQKIDVAPAHIEFFRALMRKEPEPGWLLLAPGIWLLLGLALLVAFVLRRTVFGVHTLAIGSNEATARLCRVPVDRRKVELYALLGACCGLAGCLQLARLTVGDPTTAVGLELTVIAAVVIGGGSLQGGRASVTGSLVGALIMSLLQNGCTLAGVPTYVQEIVIGAIIVAAVALDRFRLR